LKTQHQITAVIINKVNLFENEMISVNASKMETDAFIACFEVFSLKFFNILRYLCNVFIYKRYINNV